MDPITAVSLVIGILPFLLQTALDNSPKYQARLEKIRQKAIKMAEESNGYKSKIPNEYLQDANESILFPAIQTSIPYLNEKDIRKMFAKLIASAYDCRKNEYLHPGFIGIIKQLSPVDARILQYINDTQQLNGISAIKDNVEYRLIETNLLKSSDDVESISLSIDNLLRLGLINVSNKSDMAYLNNEEDAITIENAEPLSQESPIYTVLHHEYELYSVNAYMTVLGKSFLKVCVD